MKKLSQFLLSFLLLFTILSAPLAVTAATSTASAASLNTSLKKNLDDFGTKAYGQKETKSLPERVGAIINVALGLLGIVMVIYFIIGGVFWMTAGGDSQQVDKAKGYLRNAIIGLIIVMLSYTIATFVVDTLVTAST